MPEPRTHLLAHRDGIALFPLHEAFMAAVEMEDPATGEAVTFGEFLERHGGRGPAGGPLRLNPGPTVIEAEVEVLP